MSDLALSYNVDAEPAGEKIAVRVLGPCLDERIEVSKAVGLRGAVQFGAQTALDRAAKYLEAEQTLPGLLTVSVQVSYRFGEGRLDLLEAIRTEEASNGA